MQYDRDSSVATFQIPTPQMAYGLTVCTLAAFANIIIILPQPQTFGYEYKLVSMALT